MDVVGGKTEVLCDVTICDATDPIPLAIRFNVAMTSMKYLPLLSFHDVADMETFLLACKPPQQLARLEPRSANDVEPLMTFTQYMIRKQKVCRALHLGHHTFDGCFVRSYWFLWSSMKM